MVIREATPDDNSALLALTQQTPMGGVIPLIIDRQPDFFGLQRWRGPGEILVVEHQGKICATVNRTRLKIWHQGSLWSADYLCDLKVLEEYRRGMSLPRLLWAIRERIEADPPDVVLCVVARGNDLAEATIRGRAGMHAFRFVDEFAVHQILPLRREPLPNASWTIERHDGVPDDAAAFLNDDYRQLDVAPFVDPTDEVSRVSTTLLARGADGRIVAALTLLNTFSVKQNIVVDLPWYLHLLRVTVNSIPKKLGLPRLPTIGEPIKILYVRLWAAGEGAEPALRDLIARARWEAHQQGCHFLSMAGTSKADQLFRSYPNITFHSQLFAARHDNNVDVLDSLHEGRVFEDFSMV